MRWFSRKDRKSEADRRWEQHRQASTRPSPEIYLTITRTPTDTKPGSPLWCVNEGRHPVRVGTDVLVLGSVFRQQSARIVAMSRDGAAVDTLDHDEEAEVVLDDVDLSAIFRGGCLIHPDGDASNPADFAMEVQRAEPRGNDAFVVGRVHHGELAVGDEVTMTVGVGEEVRFRRVLAVEPVGDELGVLVEGRPAGLYQYGDEVSGLGGRPA
ncbi:MAG: hypothetical protein ACRCSN_00385 [Dermatophilaceae bacterium]